MFFPFGVSYEKISIDQAQGFKVLIIEPDHYSKAEIQALKKQSGANIIAYLSLGEVNKSRWYFEILKKRGFLGRNENWDSYYINLADSVSRLLFRKEIIPEIMVKGFDGLFLDTITSVAPYTNRAYLQSHMVSLIKFMRNSYPECIIIQNAGFFLLDRTSAYIDAVLIEDVASDYDFTDNKYHLKKVAEYKEKVSMLNKASSNIMKPVLVVDFADSDSLTKRIQARLDTLSYPYFIGRIELNNLSNATFRKHPQ